MGKAQVTAPIDGVVLSRAVSVGQTVQASFSAPVMISRFLADIDWSQLVGGLIVAALLVYASSEYRRRTVAT